MIDRTKSLCSLFLLPPNDLEVLEERLEFREHFQ
jgi:hypothetical protein